MSTFSDGLVKGIGWAFGLALGSIVMVAMMGTLAFGCGAGIGAGVAQVSGTTSAGGGYIHVSGDRSAESDKDDQANGDLQNITDRYSQDSSSVHVMPPVLCEANASPSSAGEGFDA